MCSIFDEWIRDDWRKVSVRLFDAIIRRMIDGRETMCALSDRCDHYLLVEYNGDVYPCDFFVEHNRKLGNIMANSWEEMRNSTKYKDFWRMKANWNRACSTCDYLRYCFGDCLKHRRSLYFFPEALSWLCNGWKRFYRHALPVMKKLANGVMRER